jgi:hypothetical protein
MVGKQELCELNERDLENEKLLKRIRNKSSLVFLSFYDIFRTPSDLRQANISQKRQRSKQSSQMSLDVDVSESALISRGICFFLDY